MYFVDDIACMRSVHSLMVSFYPHSSQKYPDKMSPTMMVPGAH